MEEKRELKMYFLVMYNISDKQKTIQAGHCVEEYSDKYSRTELYKLYRKHKTWIVLDGGTSNNGFTPSGIWTFPAYGPPQMVFYYDETKLGSMELHEKFLIDNKIPYTPFREPDLNNALSALCFICDNKVFDWENYPSFEKWYGINGGGLDTSLEEDYKRWVKFVGGKQNAKLKELIYGKKLA